MSWRKEKSEHPWATKAQAKRIARDHAKKPSHPRKPSQPKSAFNLNAAHADLAGMMGGAKRIASQMHREVH